MRKILWSSIGWYKEADEAKKAADDLRGWSGECIQTIFFHQRYGYAYVGLESIEECQAIQECVAWRINDEWIEKG